MSSITKNVRVKRVYDDVSADDGYRVLVDRIWPRGLSKASIKHDIWIKEIAPSTELRKWFAHDENKWPEFRQRYEKELRARADLVQQLLDTDDATITLLYSARDRIHNQAVVIRDYVLKTE